MHRLLLLTMLLLSPILLSGCSQLSFCRDDHCQHMEHDPAKLPEPASWYRQPVASSNHASDAAWLPYLPQSQKRLQHYVDQLAYQLAQSDAIKAQRIVISSFVELDESLTQSTPLGNQLAELLRTALPQHGILVVEHKLTSQLWVGAQGDFALSRDTRLLARQLQMDAVLTGTLITTERGMEVQARVVQLDAQTISSSASAFIPHLVLNQIRP
ncbi:FlgO family outer membrane protein [Alkalimonas sp. MEB108]|uniref:FlgO family outer membrane protein n=1 Tax=Alkalimonas cellulosilytica TaxID=3058395 RepID=A0ABU7J0Z6_9GAMM|nr:FlgO family outer membrane protein [Alkalimonas sp. MEB108]MEE2000175.1 FlgO family outer membrane protein [Alkalimonas sp. MEB108]